MFVKLIMESKDKALQQGVEDILKSVARSENINNYEVFSDYNRIQGEGFMSEFFSGEILNKDTGKKIEVAIKRAPVSGFDAGGGHEQSYKNEIYFYSKIFPELDKFQQGKKVNSPFNQIPTYLGGSLDSRNMFIAMENLNTAGYVLTDKDKLLDSEHIEFIFKTYGKLHALSFSYMNENREKWENLLSALTSTRKKLLQTPELVAMIEKGYLNALESFDPITEADILDKLKTVDNVAESLKNSLDYKGRYQCLTHGDCWSNNMLFKYKETGELEDIKLIDFPQAHSNNPFYDLSCFFYSGASKEDMDKLDYYLNLYYESFSDFARELGENPEEIFPLDVFKKEWKEYGKFGILFGCQLSRLKLLNRDDIENILGQRGLSKTKYWELWDEKMSAILERPDYRDRARNICLHAVEYGII